jgi:hypothetical protein
MTNAEGSYHCETNPLHVRSVPGSAFSNSSFVINSSFIIRILSFHEFMFIRD